MTKREKQNVSRRSAACDFWASLWENQRSHSPQKNQKQNKTKTHMLTHTYSITPAYLTNLFMYSSAKASHLLQLQEHVFFFSSVLLLQVMGVGNQINIAGNKRPAS